MIRKLALVLICCGVAGPVLADPPTTLAPVDEAAQRPDFLEFRQRLQEVVAQREGKALLDLVSARIQVGFGPGGQGREAFIDQWRPSAPDSPLWDELGRILGLGGEFIDGGNTVFCAPYVYTAFPDELDPLHYQVVIKEDALARAAPREEA
ncbi:MAG: hypothetical protein ABEJ96_08730, partial [Thiohalorhabdaceae bacterium]